LTAEYRVEELEPSGAPLDELVATILSQHTSDKNSHRAFRSLKKRFPRWSQALAAGEQAVADAIRCGGLADQKAPRILGIIRGLPQDEAGEPTLDHLRDLGPEQAFDLLTGFPGVGPKTAACVLLFAYGWPVFPVDIHVHRVARRLGWAAGKASAEKVQETMSKDVPPELTYPLHVGMVRHGRETCRPSDPHCHACVLQEACAWRRDERAERRREG
jgi:endonuclease-3